MNVRPLSTSQRHRPRAVVLERPAVRAGLGCAMGAVPEADYRVRLGTFLPFDDVELDLIAFFERFVSVQLDCRVMDEHVRPVFASDETIALGVVKPLDLTFVLSHRLLPSLGLTGIRSGRELEGNPTPIQPKTAKARERLIGPVTKQFIK